MPGDYRSVFVKPQDLKFKFARYDDPTVTLLQSDLDRLQNMTVAENLAGKSLALIIEFNLPTSSYATMALRELCKVDTSVSAQMTMNETEINETD